MKKRTHLMQLIKTNKNIELQYVEKLCNELLDLANQSDDVYAVAFANTYLADSLISQRKHSICFQYLKKAELISEEYHYHELLQQIYITGGLYYKAHFDDITAVKYYIDAYNLAVEFNKYDDIIVALNNVSDLFASKKDYAEALSYLKRAHAVFIKKGNIVDCEQNLVVILNLIQLYILNDQLNVAQDIYHQYESQITAYPQDERSDAMISSCLLHLAHAESNSEAVGQLLDHLLHDCFQNMEDKIISFIVFSSIFEILLTRKDCERCEQLLAKMGELCMNDDLEQQLSFHLCWIHFAETFHLEDSLILAYKQYYLLQKMVNDLDNKTKSESMKEKILLNHMIQEQELMKQERRILEAKINIDELTQLYNRTYFNQLCITMKKNPGVHNIGFVLVDVDYFKEYNDFYGHFQGDQLLKKIAHALDENGDSRFFAARFGGDEFICLCVNVESFEVHDYLTRVYLQLNNAHIEHTCSSISNIATVSSGFAIFKNDEDFDIDSYITLTDAAMYKAKEKGRNAFEEYKQIKPSK